VPLLSLKSCLFFRRHYALFWVFLFPRYYPLPSWCRSQNAYQPLCPPSPPPYTFFSFRVSFSFLRAFITLQAFLSRRDCFPLRPDFLILETQLLTEIVPLGVRRRSERTFIPFAKEFPSLIWERQ